ncbi:FFLEELY motif protein [Variovorax terrae]|uniref:DUF8198 domain-containing protein n=1 Tax=Variovorax terrae TaxID=2923278 RepID=A0A9X1VTE5_9BURK|nr:hypothetical protein [Variovorax terrae]MCJ0761699.1 hypothetical protein [Variovorax terrae]
MDAAQTIRHAVAEVSQLRQACLIQPALSNAVGEVKRFQSRRFAGTYADLLQGGPYQAAAGFFLDELYSDKDYAERDAQFSRIAGAMQRLFPTQVVATAVALAQLHALTEQLDHAMGQAWLADANTSASMAARYIGAWRTVARRAERESQLSVVLGIGRELDRLTRTPGLRLMLKMMRGPASAGGLGSLQRFLEAGFDTFAGMRDAAAFLRTIEGREAALIERLFDAPFVACETELQQTLGQAR